MPFEKGARFRRIPTPTGDEPSEEEGQGTMNSDLIRHVMTWLRLREEHTSEGQGLVEYAMILLLVALACIGALTALSDQMKTVLWNMIQNVLIPALGG